MAIASSTRRRRRLSPGTAVAVSPPRRRTELGLLALAAVVIVALYVLAALGKTAHLPGDVGPVLGVMIGLAVVAHLALRRFAPRADPVLLPVGFALNGVGYVFITRLNSHLAGLQAMWSAAGVIGFVGTLVVVRRVRDLERYRYTFALVGLGLLLTPLVPGIGANINGNRIWLRLGPFSIQPGEFAKLALAVFFASYLVERRELLSSRRRIGSVHVPQIRLRVLGPILLAWGFAMLVIIAEKDLGSSLLLFGLFVSMLWVTTGLTTYLVAGTGMFLAGAYYTYTAFAHVTVRVQIWLDPWKDAQGKGYQIVQSMFAFGSGGVVGDGIGLGSPTRIPAVSTDFIFAAIGEELGLVGTTAVLVAFLVMVGSGLRIALKAEREFDKLLATGLTAIIGLQAFIIIGGVTRLVPLTGITLPFVSYGGSSLVANYVLLALLLRISDEVASDEEVGASDLEPAGRGRGRPS